MSSPRERPEGDEENPGAQIMWFGKHKNEKRRFDELPEDYVQKMMNKYIEGSSNNPSYLYRFYRTYHDLNAWLEGRGLGRSPGSIKVWFGWKWKGHEMRVILQAPNRWRWFSNNTVWSNRLGQIEKEWEAWKARHPRASSGPRAAPTIINPRGEVIGPRDSVPPTDEDYDSNDSFIDDDDVKAKDDREEGNGREEDEKIGSDYEENLSGSSSFRDDQSGAEELIKTPQRPTVVRDMAFSFDQSPTAVPSTWRRTTMFTVSTLDSNGKVLTKRLRDPHQPLSSPSPRATRSVAPCTESTSGDEVLTKRNKTARPRRSSPVSKSRSGGNTTAESALSSGDELLTEKFKRSRVSRQLFASRRESPSRKLTSAESSPGKRRRQTTEDSDNDGAKNARKHKSPKKIPRTTVVLSESESDLPARRQHPTSSRRNRNTTPARSSPRQTRRPAAKKIEHDLIESEEKPLPSRRSRNSIVLVDSDDD